MQKYLVLTCLDNLDEVRKPERTFCWRVNVPNKNFAMKILSNRSRSISIKQDHQNRLPPSGAIVLPHSITTSFERRSSLLTTWFTCFPILLSSFPLKTSEITVIHLAQRVITKSTNHNSLLCYACAMLYRMPYRVAHHNSFEFIWNELRDHISHLKQETVIRTDMPISARRYGFVRLVSPWKKNDPFSSDSCCELAPHLLNHDTWYMVHQCPPHLRAW